VTEVKKRGQNRDRDGEDAYRHVRYGDEKIKREHENGTNVTG